LPPKLYVEAVKEGPGDDYGMTNGDTSKSNGTANGSAYKHDKKRKDVDEKKVIYEKHVNDNGEVLTSIKPSENYEDSLKHNGETAPREKGHERPAKRQDELASGRQAGAGWERSAYVPSILQI
jgi:2-acylglycerol O-acyltransferase 2